MIALEASRSQRLSTLGISLFYSYLALQFLHSKSLRPTFSLFQK